MTNSATTTQILASRIAAGILEFRRERRGAAAIEFAMLAPIMVGLFIGSVEFSQALTIDRRVTQVASSVADLVAQTDKLNNTDLDDMYELVKRLMAPYAWSPLKLSVTSVKKVDSNQPVVVWNYAKAGGQSYTPGQNYAGMPNGLLDNGNNGTISIIVVKSTYLFKPPVSMWIVGQNAAGINLAETFYLRPRKSLCVQNTSVTPNSVCG
jgi:Flp pilus assembly protein TadG